MHCYSWPFAGRFMFALLLAGSVLFTACNKEPEPPETVITGTVTYKGKPVTGGTLRLVLAENAERPYSGVIYEDGTYEVTYIVPGKMLIAVETATKQGLPTYVELPRKYSSPSRSGLEYTVVKGPQTHDIQLD